MSFVTDWYELSLEPAFMYFLTSSLRGTAWVSQVTACSDVSTWSSSSGSTLEISLLIVASCSAGISEGVVVKPTP